MSGTVYFPQFVCDDIMDNKLACSILFSVLFPDTYSSAQCNSVDATSSVCLCVLSKPENPTLASRRERTKCWESRDAYFACLDGVGVVKAGEEGEACSALATQYEENCAKSWIEYFNQRRIIADRQKDRLASSTPLESKTKPY